MVEPWGKFTCNDLKTGVIGQRIKKFPIHPQAFMKILLPDGRTHLFLECGSLYRFVNGDMDVFWYLIELPHNGSSLCGITWKSGKNNSQAFVHLYALTLKAHTFPGFLLLWASSKSGEPLGCILLCLIFNVLVATWHNLNLCSKPEVQMAGWHAGYHCILPNHTDKQPWR